MRRTPRKKKPAVPEDVAEPVLSAESILQEKEEQYRAIFEATTDGLVINDWDGNVVEVNPVFAWMHGYTREEMIGMPPPTFIHPDSHAQLQQFFETVKAGQQFHTHAKDIRKDGTSFPVEVHGTTFTYRGKPHILGIVRDITERVEAERQIRSRDEQYRAIFEATSDGLVIADLAGNVKEVNPAFAEALGYTREELVGMDPRKWILPSEHRNFEEYMAKVKAGERFHNEGFQVRKDGSVYPVDVSEAPFIYDGQQHTLAIIRDITERVEARELLEHRVEERTRELATLLEVASNVASTLELEPLLKRILEQLKRVADYRRATVAVEEPDEITILNSWGDQTIKTPAPGRALRVDSFGAIGAAMRRGEAIIISDVMGEGEYEEIMRDRVAASLATDPSSGETLEQRLLAERCVMYIPMMLKGNMLGGLTLRHAEPGYYKQSHADLATAIASQAAIAIENARLLAQAHDKARLEERQRLARELHDSVTQALFSISLIARSAEMVLQREGGHSGDVMEKLADLRHLTQGALAEMRALIFELRPGALEEEGLVEALRKHAAAVQGREMIQVDVIVSCSDPYPGSDLPRLKPVAEEALYRIAQEALHNVAKHARATKAEVCLEAENDALTLRVTDNGIGFDADKTPPGHMGLGTMRQRAESLHGEYRVETHSGRGTSIIVHVPLREWEEPGVRNKDKRLIPDP